MNEKKKAGDTSPCHANARNVSLVKIHRRDCTITFHFLE